MKDYAKYVYILAIVLIALPLKAFGCTELVSPALALFAGLVFALIFPMPYPKYTKKGSERFAGDAFHGRFGDWRDGVRCAPRLLDAPQP